MRDIHEPTYSVYDVYKEHSSDMAAGDASVGSLKIPSPKPFKGTGSEDDASDYESFANQLKAYLSLQNPRFRDLMNVAEQNVFPSASRPIRLIKHWLLSSRIY